MDSTAMPRLLALVLAVLLVGTGAAPAAGAQVERAQAITPLSAMAAPPTAGVSLAPSSLAWAGTLRIRAIGLTVRVYRWSCSDSGIPNRALLWRCSGTRNQFIFGHAYGVFHPYYRAWNQHRLKSGIVATFTDRKGRVTRYKLAWARKVPRTYLWRGLTGERWAWSATSRPSITLQTCWGATNSYRIVTRFVQG